MANRVLFIFYLLVLFSSSAWSIAGSSSPEQDIEAFVGQDLHLVGRELISYQLSTGEYALVFQDGFSMSIGANQFSSDNAVVWLESIAIEFRGRVRVDYKAIVYLRGSVSVNKTMNARTTDLNQTVLERGRTMIVQFDVSGEVFVTADKREVADPRELELYLEAVESCRAIGIEAI